MLKPPENLVDRRERLQFNIGPDPAAGRKGERFHHVLAGADQRTPDGDAVGDDVEQRRWEFTGRQAHEHAGAPFARHAHPLFEGGERGGGDQNAMRPAAGPLFDGRHGVARAGIDGELGAQFAGMGELAVINVNRADVESHGLGILDCQMAESTNP